MIISALPKYKIVKRGGWENLCSQTETAFAKYKREGNNFGFQIFPMLSCFVLAVLITSSSMQRVLLTLYSNSAQHIGPPPCWGLSAPQQTTIKKNE